MRLALFGLLVAVLLGHVLTVSSLDTAKPKTTNNHPNEKPTLSAATATEKENQKTVPSAKKQYKFPSSQLENKKPEATSAEKKPESKKSLIEGASLQTHKKKPDATEKKLMNMLKDEEQAKPTLSKSKKTQAFLDSQKSWLQEGGDTRSMLDTLSTGSKYGDNRSLKHMSDQLRSGLGDAGSVRKHFRVMNDDNLKGSNYQPSEAYRDSLRTHVRNPYMLRRQMPDRNEGFDYRGRWVKSAGLDYSGVEKKARMIHNQPVYDQLRNRLRGTDFVGRQRHYLNKGWRSNLKGLHRYEDADRYGFDRKRFRNMEEADGRYDHRMPVRFYKEAYDTMDESKFDYGRAVLHRGPRMLY